VRNVFLALIVVNLVFFGWANWVDAPAKTPTVADRDAGIPQLQLVSNSIPGPTPSPTSASAVAAAVAAAMAASAPDTATRCRSLGPFEDVNAANTAADRMRSHGLSPRDRSAESSNPNVYWVYIGELTADMQRRAIQTLNAAGIHDAAPMTQPEQSDRLSVGVFADQSRAVRRAEQVRTLGFKPTLGMRQRTMTAHWLDFDVKTADPDPSPAELLGGPTVRAQNSLGPLKVSDCPASGTSG
jgi:hypothetical protein